MELKEQVKLALRINHSLLDDEIEFTIRSAELELERLGISECAIENKDELVKMACKTYCLAMLHNNESMQKTYMESFDLQVENIRKSSKYINV